MSYPRGKQVFSVIKLWKETKQSQNLQEVTINKEREGGGTREREGGREEKNTFPGHKLSVFPEIPWSCYFKVASWSWRLEECVTCGTHYKCPQRLQHKHKCTGLCNPTQTHTHTNTCVDALSYTHLHAREHWASSDIKIRNDWKEITVCVTRPSELSTANQMQHRDVATGRNHGYNQGLTSNQSKPKSFGCSFMRLLLQLFSWLVSILIFKVLPHTKRKHTCNYTHMTTSHSKNTYSTTIKRYSGEFLFSSFLRFHLFPAEMCVCVLPYLNKLAQLDSHTHIALVQCAPYTVMMVPKLVISNTVSSVILDLNLSDVWNRFDAPHILAGGWGRAGRDGVLGSPYPIYVAAILSKASIKPTHVKPKAGRIIALCDGAVKRNQKGERGIRTFLCWCGKRQAGVQLFITKSDGIEFFHRFSPVSQNFVNCRLRRLNKATLIQSTHFILTTVIIICWRVAGVRGQVVRSLNRWFFLVTKNHFVSASPQCRPVSPFPHWLSLHFPS